MVVSSSKKSVSILLSQDPKKNLFAEIRKARRFTMLSNEQKFAEYYKRLEETNEKFLSADPPTKRVMLAQDVLLQLKLEKFHPASNYYSPIVDGLAYYSPFNFIENHVGKDLRDALRVAPACHVCNIGSLFISAVERLDKITVDTVLSSSRVRGKMVEYLARLELFSEEELEILEDFFELNSPFLDHPLYDAMGWEDVTKYNRMKRSAEVIIATEGKVKMTLELLAKELPLPEEGQDLYDSRD